MNYGCEKRIWECKEEAGQWKIVLSDPDDVSRPVHDALRKLISSEQQPLKTMGKTRILTNWNNLVILRGKFTLDLMGESFTVISTHLSRGIWNCLKFDGKNGWRSRDFFPKQCQTLMFVHDCLYYIQHKVVFITSTPAQNKPSPITRRSKRCT